MGPLTDEEYTSILTTELPSPSDPVIQKYLSSRAALINEESKQRSDSSFRQALSPIGKRACDIVGRIRDEEQRQHVDVDITTPDAMVKTKSWAVIKRLPKGALLRAQYDALALANIDHLITLALETPGMCMSASDGNLATAEAREDITRSFQIRSRKNNPKSEQQSIWGADYKGGTFVPLTKAADEYPEGGRPGFIKWLKVRCSWSGDATKSSQDEKAEKPPSAKGRADSHLLRGMLYYEPIFRKFLRHLLRQLTEDGISWTELRLTFPLDYYRTGSELPDPDSDHLFAAIGQEVASYHRQATTASSTGPGPGQRPPFWGLRIIWSTIRSQDQRSIIEDADSCIAAKLLWPDLVAGYDLAGAENLGRSLTDMLPELFWFRKQCSLEEVDIPFFLGAGGGSDAVSEGNLFDALLLGTRRLGAARSLYRHPRMVEAVKDKRILAENYLAPGTVGGDTSDHPLPALIAQGVPCALSLGDAEEYVGEGGPLELTHQFWQALHAWESLDLAGLGSLAENSVRWAAFGEQSADSWIRDIRAASVGSGVKAKRLKDWAVEWERFCLWIVTEYGETHGDGHDGDGDGDGGATASAE
ncbi:hypothetical protein QBC36DRAFT_79342 [Triangularia setosa]|uniref:Adenosine deaminase domain-containing protein n=1 Tax=Triangularia setosa TaxID=2587417 RepID=A0AAN6WC92_9PEZI|nr:hypothetical protein QBC36DRAFT_79342 [Podospora setosa]